MLIADVISKQLVVAHLSNRGAVTVIPSVLDLELTRNAGAAFGFAAGATIIFSVVAAAVVVLHRARRPASSASTGWAWALGLLLGGALGNLGDRLFRAPGPLRGHVVDWIHLHHWPVFNLADSGDRRRRPARRAAVDARDPTGRRRGARRPDPSRRR